MDSEGITQVELADALGVTRGAINHKVAGRRPWGKENIDAALAFLAERLGRPVTYEEAFGPPDPAPLDPGEAVDASIEIEREG
jgi:transcriptional regulator with XRE-family HTH domain